MGEVVEEKSSLLLGFKDSVPVISNSETKKTPEGNVKKILKVEVDPSTGEKYINLNGKKLKMVPESQIQNRINLSDKKKMLLQSTKNLRILTKIPFTSDSICNNPPIKIESPDNLGEIQNTNPLDLKNNSISLKNINNTDKDSKYVIDSTNLTKEITTDNRRNGFNHTGSSAVYGQKCSLNQRISARNLIDMKIYQNDKEVQTLESRINQVLQAGELLKDVAIQTEEGSFNKNKTLDYISELERNNSDSFLFNASLDAILETLNNDSSLLQDELSLLDTVSPLEVNPPAQETFNLAAKFFGELRRARLPDQEGNM